MSGSQVVYNFFNQQYLATEIVSTFAQTPPVKEVVISGPAGSGKSYLIKEISQNWITENNITATLNIHCDGTQKEINYQAFSQAIIQATRNQSPEKIIVKGATELSKGIPYAGDFIGFLIKTFGDLNDAKQSHETRYLNDIEKMLVYDLSKLANGKSFLITIDNIQRLDESSLSFIKLLTNKQFLSSVPALQNLKFVYSVNPDNESQKSPTLSEILDGETVIKKELSYVTLARYIDALKKFGFSGTLKKEIIQVLYSLTNGHLLLIKKLAEYLSDTKRNSKEFEDIEIWKDPDIGRSKLIESLLSAKLKELGADGLQIISLLEYASVIGLSFSFDELSCITKENEESLRDIITRAKEEQLLEQDRANSFFSHDIIREFFLSRLNNRQSKYCGLFANCLSILRPSDYNTRAQYLFEAGNIEECLTVYIHKVLQDLREGVRTSPIITQRIKKLQQTNNTQEFYDAITAAYTNFNKGAYEVARSAIEGIEDYLPKTLIAEKYYLLSLCQLKTMTQEDLEQAKQSLLGWDDLEASESEIWMRLMSTLMTVHGNLGDFNAAQTVARKMMVHLERRKNFDTSAEYSINVIRRKASALSGNEISCERTKKSLDYFSARDIEGRIIYPAQYYYSLTNHAANLIVRGDYKDAAELSGMALNLLNEFEYINFLEPQIPASNYIISGYLSSLVSPGDATALFEKIKPYEGEVADNLLVKNNYFVTMIEAGELSFAIQGLETLWLSIKDKQIDNYYRYFIQSNLILAKYVHGEVEQARDLWPKLQNLIPNIPDKTFLNHRHKIIGEILSIAEIGNVRIFDDYISQKYPSELGRQWKFYGRGFLLSDIQLWYES